MSKISPPLLNDNLIFGIDLGIASCGWAVIERKENETPRILSAGSWCFNTPEDEKKKPLNQNRRAKRLLRRVIRRRRQRMQKIRALFHQAGLFQFDPDISLGTEGLKLPDGKALNPENREILGQIGAYLRKESWDSLSPWTLRVRGLDVRLSGPELAVALGHIAKHRGFKSNAKNPSGDDGEIKENIYKIAKILEKEPNQYRSFAEVLTSHPDYQADKGRLRNRNKIYDRTPSRDLLLKEVKDIFENQRDLGSKLATEKLEKDFIDIAFFQRGLQDSIKLLGHCQFEPSEKRASMKAPSFEKFRLFSKLNHMALLFQDEDGVVRSRPFSKEELRKIADYISNGPQAKLTFKTLRKILELADDTAFEGITSHPDEWKKEEAKKEVALNSTKGKGSLAGCAALFEILGVEIWRGLNNFENGQKILDDCAEILSFYASPENMKKAFAKRHFPEEMAEKLIEAAEEGKFSDFTQAGNLSAKACRNLLPHLLAGNVYSEACAKAHYDHSATSWDSRAQLLTHQDFTRLTRELAEGDDTIANPSARKALTEGLKQLWAMRNKWGIPGKIAVELARDVGKSADERGKMAAGLNRTTADRNKERLEAAGALGREPHLVSGETLLRYRLWKEQGGFCLYSGKAIPPGAFNSPEFQVDHILPWSRFGDDSYNNKTLAYLSENQKKGNKTPKEYLSEVRWEIFKEAVENLRCKGMKKRNYLLLKAAEKEETFRTRNLNDTKYAARLFAQCAELLYDKKDRSRSKGTKRRVFTRPGSLTAALRQGWEVEHLKKEKEKNPETGRRERLSDDRHHALDAICVACVDEKEILKIQKSFKENEGKLGDDRNLRKAPLPWDSFPEDVKNSLEKITVARPENRRARGQGHEETIRSFKKHPETAALQQVSSRKSLTGLKKTEVEKLLPKLKDPERNPHIIASLEKWIEAGCPADKMPRSPKGDEIRHIVVTENQKSGVELQTGDGKGLVSAGAISRVDVFSKKKTSGKNKGQKEFYLVPVYRWQIVRNILPMHACVGGKDENEWILMDEAQGFSFEFSLYSGSYVKIGRKQKEEIQITEGYFAGMDRSTASVGIKNSRNPQDISRSIGVKNLPFFEKYQIDRFGVLSPAGREVRQWHGKTSI